METVKYFSVCASDLGYLFGCGEVAIRQWVKAGCPRSADGSFVLSKVIRWREKQHKNKLATKLQIPISQAELVKLLGVSRQQLSAWRQAGLRPGRNGYSLPAVVRWLRSYYETAARKKYKLRLKTLRKKLGRNSAQLHKFLSSGNE